MASLQEYVVTDTGRKNVPGSMPTFTIAGKVYSDAGALVADFTGANAIPFPGVLVTLTGANAIKLLGPSYQDFQLPVAATSTTVSVYGRYDGTYTGTKPSMSVLNGTECGVSNATATMTGASGAWEQLSLNFTPTSTGVVTIRLLSSDTNGGGACFFDDFAVT